MAYLLIASYPASYTLPRRHFLEPQTSQHGHAFEKLIGIIQIIAPIAPRWARNCFGQKYVKDQVSKFVNVR